MSDYPGAVDTFRTIENIPGQSYDPTKKTTIYAEDIQALAAAVVALEETLGVNPQGDNDSVVARLNDLGIEQFKNIGETILTSEADTIEVIDLEECDYLTVYIDLLASGGTLNTVVNFNNDFGGNYRMSYTSSNAPGTNVDTGTSTGIPVEVGVTALGQKSHTSLNISNVLLGAYLNGAFNNNHYPDGSTVQAWLDGRFRYIHGGNPVTRIRIGNSGTGNFGVGSRIVVFGSRVVA